MAHGTVRSEHLLEPPITGAGWQIHATVVFFTALYSTYSESKVYLREDLYEGNAALTR